jgi:hypothetical protein
LGNPDQDGYRPRLATEITPAELADRLAIRDLFDAYARCADTRDVEGQ